MSDVQKISEEKHIFLIYRQFKWPCVRNRGYQEKQSRHAGRTNRKLKNRLHIDIGKKRHQLRQLICLMFCLSTFQVRGFVRLADV